MTPPAIAPAGVVIGRGQSTTAAGALTVVIVAYPDHIHAMAAWTGTDAVRYTSGRAPRAEHGDPQPSIDHATAALTAHSPHVPPSLLQPARETARAHAYAWCDATNPTDTE